MEITIYKIENPIGKVYIGQTKNYAKRIGQYKILHCHKQKRLHNSLKKYGFANHIFTIVEVVDSSISDEREIFWMKYFKCHYKDENKGLNLAYGGRHHLHTDDVKKYLSEINSGGKHPKAKKLYQYEQDGTFVKEWSCMKDIERELKYVTTWLSKAIKNNKIAYGYKWSYTPMHL